MNPDQTSVASPGWDAESAISAPQTQTGSVIPQYIRPVLGVGPAAHSAAGLNTPSPIVGSQVPAVQPKGVFGPLHPSGFRPGAYQRPAAPVRPVNILTGHGGSARHVSTGGTPPIQQ